LLFEGEPYNYSLINIELLRKDDQALLAATAATFRLLEPGSALLAPRARIDILPGQCNNVASSASDTLQIAVAGNAFFDLSASLAQPVALNGIVPIDVELSDVLLDSPSQCNSVTGDGYPDLVLTFSTDSLRALFPPLITEPGYFTLSFEFAGESYSASDVLLLEDQK
jgi:hypothetical protein